MGTRTPRPRPRAPLCRAAAAAAALRPGPRLVLSAEGRGAGGAARPALSGSRPRGGASSAPAPLLHRVRRARRSPSGHCSAAAGCQGALTPGLALGAFFSEQRVAASPQASGSERAWGREVGAELRASFDPARRRGHPASADRVPRAAGNGGAVRGARRPQLSPWARGPQPPLLAGRPPFLLGGGDAIARGLGALVPSGGRVVPHASRHPRPAGAEQDFQFCRAHLASAGPQQPGRCWRLCFP